MTDTAPDDRLIVALDVADALAGLQLADRLGPDVGFYKIGLGMLTGGGLALANELKHDHGKRIFLDLKLFDIAATVEAAVVASCALISTCSRCMATRMSCAPLARGPRAARPGSLR